MATSPRGQMDRGSTRRSWAGCAPPPSRSCPMPTCPPGRASEWSLATTGSAWG